MKLHLGCGHDIWDGWVNVDRSDGEGVDVVADLDDPNWTETVFQLVVDHRADQIMELGTVTDFALIHVLEHIHNRLPLMEALWHLATPDATLIAKTPHGAHEVAWEDPTHVVPMYPGSFAFFAAPVHWRADMGYGGDWQTERVWLLVDQDGEVGRIIEDDPDRAVWKVTHERNHVIEMVAELRAVKPARAKDKELIVDPKVLIVPAEQGG